MLRKEPVRKAYELFYFRFENLIFILRLRRTINSIIYVSHLPVLFCCQPVFGFRVLMLTINLFKYSPIACCQGGLIDHLISLSGCQFVRYLSGASALYRDNDGIQLSNTFCWHLLSQKSSPIFEQPKLSVLAGLKNSLFTRKQEVYTERN